MKIRTLGRHFLTSFKSLGRNGWMTVASISAVTITLFLLGSFLVVMMNLDNFAKNIEEDVEIKVFVDIVATEDQQTTLNKQIKGISGIESIEYSSKENELNSLVESFGEDGKVFELFEQDNPLHDAFVVKAKSPRDTEVIAAKIAKLDHVTKVEYGKDEISQLFSIVDTARQLGTILILALAFTAMFLISNTIKITIFARRTEIEIMRLVGATNWFIRWPFLIEGLLLGLLGSLIPIGGIYWGYTQFYSAMGGQLNGSFLELLPAQPFLWQIGLILATIGSVIGMWGSTMSIHKFLKI